MRTGWTPVAAVGAEAILPVMMLALALAAAIQEPPPPPITVLGRGRAVEVADARVVDGHLWLPLDALPTVSGFTHKPEGICAGELCIPVPPDAAWVRETDGGPAIDVTAFADHVGQAWVAGPRQRAFSFAPVPALRASGLGAGLAPDFELPDREGRPVRLSDLRGKKVLLLTWASW